MRALDVDVGAIADEERARGIGARGGQRPPEDVRARLAPADGVGHDHRGEDVQHAGGLEDPDGGRRVVEVRDDGEPVVPGQPAEQRPVVGRKRRGLRQLSLVGLDEHRGELRRERRVLQGQPVEEVAEPFGRSHFAVIDRAQPLGLLPRGHERVVALAEAHRGRVRLEQRVQASRRRADRAAAHVDLR